MAAGDAAIPLQLLIEDDARVFYYLTEGGCKYRKAYKYNHSRIKGAISPVLDFNFLSLPIRLSEKDCPYYMRTSTCKYASNCRFHHSDPTTVTGNNPSFGYNNVGSAPEQSASYSSVSSWSSPRALNETAPFVPVEYLASEGIFPLGPQRNRYRVPLFSVRKSPSALGGRELES
ncbi:zinc finger CCCH domain-containing protein 67-like [Solanum dulcamara]|uniref:zinc finger CCCH domain-containing protein 67-like n=1 Tax=Solanum dulcamara TaxID=45834 RepID=UPI002485CC9A|nr:zinc finger CCCH domain-containing protein 67-like [Solanum dulcamara]